MSQEFSTCRCGRNIEYRSTVFAGFGQGSLCGRARRFHTCEPSGASRTVHPLSHPSGCSRCFLAGSSTRSCSVRRCRYSDRTARGQAPWPQSQILALHTRQAEPDALAGTGCAPWRRRRRALRNPCAVRCPACSSARPHRRNVASSHRTQGSLRCALDRRAHPHHQPRQPRGRTCQVRLLLVHPQPRQAQEAARRSALHLPHPPTLRAGQSPLLPSRYG